jgi:hypothetical protein
MTVAAVTIVATTAARDPWVDDGEDIEDTVVALIMEKITTAAMVMGKGKERRLGHEVRMLTRNCQK